MTETGNGLVTEITPDPDPLDPRREYDTFGRMVCWHSRYALGDAHDWPTPDDFRAAMPDQNIVKLPVFFYDHSGLTISTTPFSCPWDSGQIGWIFQTRAKILKEFKRQRLSITLREQVNAILAAEVAEYDCYLRGDVWTATIREASGDIRDSVSGLVGYDHAVEEAQIMRRAVDPGRA